jgi:cytochrome c-type biogenesis protein CcmH
LLPCDNATEGSAAGELNTGAKRDYFSSMTIWFIFAAMTAVLLAALLWPMGRRDDAPARSAFGQAIFRDQLAELERDVARGSIGAEEAQAARNEIARRLIGEKEDPSSSAPRSTRWVSWLAVALIPAIALPLYLHFGSPALKDVPLRERLAGAVENNDFEALVAKVEAHLAANPDDVQGWTVLAPAYKRMQRFGDAAAAYANILRLSRATADLYADYAEMLVFANDGMVTADAARAFGEALKIDSTHPAARFFSGLALKQEGKTEAALATWRALLADTPPDAGWRDNLEQEIASLTGAKAPTLTEEQMAAAQNMNAGDRQTMIRSMVDGLEARLETDGNDIEGWQRLIRARVVLGETDKAKAAYSRARQHFAGQPDALTTLASLAKELKIE